MAVSVLKKVVVCSFSFFFGGCRSTPSNPCCPHCKQMVISEFKLNHVVFGLIGNELYNTRKTVQVRKRGGKDLSRRIFLGGYTLSFVVSVR